MSHTILVVDDTKFMRKMLTDMLKQFGYEVVGEADNGRQAVQKYRELHPDVVMMDITMPEMDGIEAMREIRKIDPRSVILICSAMSQQDLISDALKAGANGYVMKPFKPNRVNEVIKKNVAPKIQLVKPSPEKEPQPEPVEEEKQEPAAVETAAQIPAEPAEAEAGPAAAVEEEPAEPQALEEELQSRPEEPVEPLPELAEEPAAVETEALPELAAVEQAEPEPLPAEASLQEEDTGTAHDEELAASLESMDSPVQGQEIETSLTGVDEHDEPLYLEEEPEAEAIADAATGKESASETDGVEWSLDDLNELTMIMDGLDEDTSGLLEDVLEPERTDTSQNELQSPPKIIPIIRGGTNMKKFISSYMCNWSEEVNGKSLSYLVICTESENRITLESKDENQVSQTLEVSLEGFKQLMYWLEDKLAAGSNVRELPRKAEL